MKQYANLSAGAWKRELDHRVMPTPEEHAKLGRFLGFHACEYHSLLEWNRLWERFER